MGPKNLFESSSTADESVSFHNVLALCERATAQESRDSGHHQRALASKRDAQNKEWFGMELVKLAELLGKFIFRLCCILKT